MVIEGGGGGERVKGERGGWPERGKRGEILYFIYFFIFLPEIFEVLVADQHWPQCMTKSQFT